MTDTEHLQKRLVEMIGRRVRSGESGASIAAVARLAYDDLATVLISLVSEEGFAALVARAFYLVQREYPTDAPATVISPETEPLEEIARWLDRQDRTVAIDAAAAMFATLAGLLIALIGESLTTRYLQKAWPDDFSIPRHKGRRA